MRMAFLHSPAHPWHNILLQHFEVHFLCIGFLGSKEVGWHDVTLTRNNPQDQDWAGCLRLRDHSTSPGSLANHLSFGLLMQRSTTVFSHQKTSWAVSPFWEHSEGAQTSSFSCSSSPWSKATWSGACMTCTSNPPAQPSTWLSRTCWSSWQGWRCWRMGHHQWWPPVPSWSPSFSWCPTSEHAAFSWQWLLIQNPRNSSSSGTQFSWESQETQWFPWLSSQFKRHPGCRFWSSLLSTCWDTDKWGTGTWVCPGLGNSNKEAFT